MFSPCERLCLSIQFSSFNREKILFEIAKGIIELEIKSEIAQKRENLINFKYEYRTSPFDSVEKIKSLKIFT